MKPHRKIKCKPALFSIAQFVFLLVPDRHGKLVIFVRAAADIIKIIFFQVFFHTLDMSVDKENVSNILMAHGYKRIACTFYAAVMDVFVTAVARYYSAVSSQYAAAWRNKSFE